MLSHLSSLMSDGKLRDLSLMSLIFCLLLVEELLEKFVKSDLRNNSGLLFSQGKFSK